MTTSMIYLLLTAYLITLFYVSTMEIKNPDKVTPNDEYNFIAGFTNTIIGIVMSFLVIGIFREYMNTVFYVYGIIMSFAFVILGVMNIVEYSIFKKYNIYKTYHIEC